MKENKTGNNIIKTIAIIASLLILIGIFVFLVYGYIKNTTLNVSNPIATIEVENYGTIKVELYPDKALNTVKNFIKLANNEYYNGKKFSTVEKDVYILAGGATNKDEETSLKLGDLYKDENDKEYAIKGEFVSNGFNKNDLNITEGVIVMYRSDYTNYSPQLYKESYNSAGAQFFIMTSNEHTSISGRYAGFGRVIEGMDVVKKIADAELKVSYQNEESENKDSLEKTQPKDDIKITSIKVDTFGLDYGMPETLESFNLMNWFTSQYSGEE